VESLGYKSQMYSDCCVFIKISKTGHPIILATFVDDLLVAYCLVDEDEVNADIALLYSHFELTNMGDVALILGMRVTRDRKKRSIKLDQQSYTNDMMHEFGIEEKEHEDDPSTSVTELIQFATMPTTDLLTQHSKLVELNQHEYASAVGSIQYAACNTRPDISFMTNQLAAFNGTPCIGHVKAVRKLLCYMNHTSHIGLHYATSDATVPLQLYAHSDADWAKNIENRKSISGHVIYLDGCPILWKSEKQKCTSQSTQEAEYVAASECAKQLIWCQRLCADFQYESVGLPILYIDNAAAIALTQAEQLPVKARHIDLRYHFVRQCYMDGNLSVQHISSKYNGADILTKSMIGKDYNHARSVLMRQ
jgi:hypothetical protein